MIEWIEKLPDWTVGVLTAGGLWFGFNYMVLAERAMDKEHIRASIPHCLEALEQQQREERLPLDSLDGIGQAFGLPELGRLGRQLAEQSLPRALTVLEMNERCLCAARNAAQTMRFDYAVHTATFRFVTPQSVAALRDQAARVTLRGVCGASMDGKK